MTDEMRWGERFGMCSGSEEAYQHLYRGNESVGFICVYDYDGDCGVNAYTPEKKLIGRYRDSDKAKNAVEKYAKKIVKSA